MTYTADNIANIKSMGALDGYIASERKLVDALSAAIVEDVPATARDDEYSERIIQVGHLYGRYGSTMGDTYAYIVAGGDWSKSWPTPSFASNTAARAYARAALVNELKKCCDRILAGASKNLAALEAAR